MSLLARICLYLGIHDWEVTSQNGFRLPCERVCRLTGRTQHRVWESIASPSFTVRPEWRDGPHPIQLPSADSA